MHHHCLKVLVDSSDLKYINDNFVQSECKSSATSNVTCQQQFHAAKIDTKIRPAKFMGQTARTADR